LYEKRIKQFIVYVGGNNYNSFKFFHRRLKKIAEVL